MNDVRFIDQLFWFAVFGGGLYFMIFHTKKCKEVNDMMYDNVRRTTGGFAKAGKVGWTIFKLFRR